MNEEPCKPTEEHPADLILECPPACDTKGYKAERDFVSTNPPGNVSAKGHGYGWSRTSQIEADNMALERAMEEASKLLWFKVKAIAWVAHIFGLRIAARMRKFRQRHYPNVHLIAPQVSPWCGTLDKKPWHYKVTAVIPHVETPEALVMCVRLLRAQTEKPYILVIDTGSTQDVKDQMELLRGPDLEIHYIMAHAYQHASAPVTTAMDLAHALCRTEFLYHTHADCFLKRFDFLDMLVRMCNSQCPVIGYRMSPRDWATDEWKWMVGHTNTMLHIPTIERLGLTWSMERMHRQYGVGWAGGGWPDTEVGWNYGLREAGIKPVFIGYDENYIREIDVNRDHVRSYPGSKIGGGAFYEKRAEWMLDALKDAEERLSFVNETQAAASTSSSPQPSLA